MTTLKTNASTIGRNLSRVLDGKQLSDTGVFLVINENGDDLSRLCDRYKAAKKADESIRALMVEFYYATPEGEAEQKQYNALAAKGKQRTAVEDENYKSLRSRQNSVNMRLVRLLDIFDGVTALRAAGRTVAFDTARDAKGQPTNAWYCHVFGAGEPAQPFTQAALANVRKVFAAGPSLFDDAGKLKKEATTATLFASCRDYEAPKPASANKGNGERIDQSKIGDAIRNLDTSIAAYEAPESSKRINVSEAAREDLALLWVRLDHLLSEKQKAKAREAYTADADKTSKPAASTIDKLKAAVGVTKAATPKAKAAAGKRK